MSSLFITLLELSDTKVYEPHIRALLGTAGAARLGGAGRIRVHILRVIQHPPRRGGRSHDGQPSTPYHELETLNTRP